MLNINQLKEKLKKVCLICLGIFVKPIGRFFSIDQHLWVFGAGKGEAFIDNSKYLFLYTRDFADNIQPVWITTNSELINYLRSNGYECYHNYSFNGILKVLRAGVCVFCTNRSDIHFYAPSRQKKVINLFHGMPIKKIVYDFHGHDLNRKPFFDQLWNSFVAQFKWEDSDFIPTTSDFFSPFLKTAFRSDEIYETGLPRNDIFFSASGVHSQFNGIDKEKDEFLIQKEIISYLPTHRKFGRGEINPIPFTNDKEIKSYFLNRDTYFLYKAHYNYESEGRRLENDQILDISNWGIDTQYLLKYSDILITDYSSCFIDYLLLDRPILFYFYDDYQIEDNKLYFDIEKPSNVPGPICRSEKELKKAVIDILENGDKFQEKRKKFLTDFHKYNDGKNCERVMTKFIEA